MERNYVFLLFKLYKSPYGCFDKHGCSCDNVSKLATVDLLRINVFQNKDYGVIIFVYDITNKTLSRDLSHTVYVVT